MFRIALSMWQATEEISLKRFDRFIVLSAVLLGALFSGSVLAQNAGTPGTTPAIGGYSPVSYFTKNKAELGSPEFAVEHGGTVYYLASQEQVEIFEKNPNKYRPRYRSCPYSLAFGKILPVDPTNFKIVGDNLLLFHLSDDENGLQLWNDSKISEDELMRRAEANWFRLSF